MSLTSASAPRRMRPHRALVAAAIIALFWGALAFLPVEAWIDALRTWTSSHGLLGWAVFAIGYAALTFILIPGALLMLAAGLAFGMDGVAPVLAGFALSACVGFLTGRTFGRARVKALVARRPKLAAIDKAVAAEGWMIALLMPLSGVIPFNLQSMALGSTSIRFVPYLLATLVGVLPGTLVYVWAGSLGWAAGGDVGPLKWLLLGLGVTAIGLTTILISRRAHQILEKYGVETDDQA